MRMMFLLCRGGGVIYSPAPCHNSRSKGHNHHFNIIRYSRFRRCLASAYRLGPAICALVHTMARSPMSTDVNRIESRAMLRHSPCHVRKRSTTMLLPYNIARGNGVGASGRRRGLLVDRDQGTLHCIPGPREDQQLCTASAEFGMHAVLPSGIHRI